MDGIAIVRPAPYAVAARPADRATTAGPAAPTAAGDRRSGDASARPGDLTEPDRARVRELRARDREVRAHEQAHLAAAGPHARGGASYTFATGPDGRRYAVGGEVQIDTSPAGDPAATLAKARQIQRAALAPAQPSPQDRRVAADAAAMAASARAELGRERTGAGYPGESDPVSPASFEVYA